MPDQNGGVRWYLRLLLDKKSVDAVKKETAEALDKGTDPTNAKRNVGEVRTAMDKLVTAAKALGATLVTIWGVQQVVAYGKAVFALASQVNATASQFKTVFGDLSSGLETSLESWRAIAGITRTEMRGLLAAAGSMAQGMGMSQQASADFGAEVIKLAGDLASFSGGTYTTQQAAQLLQSALIGNTEAARSLMINFTALDVQHRALEMTGKKSADALTQQEKALAGLSVITERAGPQLGDLVRTQKDADNQAKILSASWRQMKEDIAVALIPTFGALFDTLRDTGAVDKLAAAAKLLADNMGEVVASVTALIKALVVGGGIVALTRLVGAIRAARLATTAWTAAMAGARVMMGPTGWFILGVAALEEYFRRSGKAARDAAAQLDDYTSSLSALSKQQLLVEQFTLNDLAARIQQRVDSISSVTQKSRLIPGVGVQMQTVANPEYEKLQAQLDGVIKRSVAVADALKGIDQVAAPVVPVVPDPTVTPLTDAEKKAAEKRIRALWDHLADWSATNGPTGLAGESGTTAALRAERERREQARKDFEARGGSLDKVPVTPGGPTRLTGEWEELGKFESAYRSMMANVEEVSSHAAMEMASAFEDAFGLMREEGANIGSFFEGLGRGLAGSMLQGLAEYARGKAKENVAAAIEAGAKALGFMGMLSPGQASAEWASAAQHAAAAVAWSAAAGAAGAGRAAVTGGRGAVPIATRDAGLSTAENAARTGPEINIYIDPLDPSRPAYQRNVYAAQQYAKERFGEDASVNIRPYAAAR